jgi:hypothetical protein
MKAIWLRRKQVEARFALPVRLPSATPQIAFEAQMKATFQSGRTQHNALEALVRSNVVDAARETAQKWHADEIDAAQDAINARLGKATDSPGGTYRRLIASAKLRISAAERDAANQWRNVRHKIEHLEYLKAQLYSDPSLLMIDYLEREGAQIMSLDVNTFHRIVISIRQFDHWWSPLMVAWSELAARADSPETLNGTMAILLDSIRRLDSKLADRHGLPNQVQSGWS